MADKSYTESIKEGAQNAYDALKDTAQNAREAVFGEKPKEDQAADKVKEFADSAADNFTDIREGAGESNKPTIAALGHFFATCQINYNFTADRVHELGEKLR